MANENVSTIDEYGRVVVPKEIRDKLKTNDIVFVYDEKNKDVHVVPVRNLKYWAGKSKGITKDYLKTHKEDWDGHSRR